MTEVYYKEKYTYHGAGFPVVLTHVPFRKMGKDEVFLCDTELLDLAIAKLVLLKPAILTGNEVRFLRAMINESMEKFSSHFNHSPATIKNWEDRKNEPVSMSYEIDYAIRSTVATVLQLEQQISTNFLVHSSVLKASEYRSEPISTIQIPAKDIEKSSFFKTEPVRN